MKIKNWHLVLLPAIAVLALLWWGGVKTERQLRYLPRIPDPRMLRELDDTGTDFKQQFNCWGVLREAARKGDAFPDLSQFEDIDPILKNLCMGRTPLFFTETAEQVETLIEAGLDPNIQDEDGRTALFVHVIQAMQKPSKQYEEMIVKLLELGADPRIEDRSGEQPSLASRVWNSTASQYWRGRKRLERILDKRGMTLEEFFELAPRMKGQLDFLFERMMIAGRIQYHLGYAMSLTDPNRSQLAPQNVAPSGLEATVDSILEQSRASERAQ